ncbi:MAG: Fic family protein [Deltaproteobacteria bacterium]|nr:Fic family protein [Deltaproteobacteria bacterium]
MELRQVTNERTGETIEVVGGEFRTRDVEVGQHVGPTAQSLPAFLTRFASFYESGAHHGVKPLLAAAASHHRLMWIHPFLDGNGRVARLYTDACFRRVPVLGYGLWNVSRGLARRRAEYMEALARADQPRRNDLDGRGNLSNEGLGGFCRFFLEVCLDQVRFSGSLLKLDGLLERLRGYVGLREQRLVRDRAPLKPQAAYMLQEVLLRGTVARGDLFRVSGMPERTNCWTKGSLGPIRRRGRFDSPCRRTSRATFSPTSTPATTQRRRSGIRGQSLART